MSRVRLAFAYNFCLMCCYYIMQPVRDALGVEDPDKLPHLFAASLFVMMAANPVFASLVKRYPPSRFIPMVYRFFGLNLLAFYGLLVTQGGELAGKIFFLWVGVFNLFAISVFWSFVANVFDPDEAKSLYGYIGAGGTAGQLAGSLLTMGLAPRLGAIHMLALSFLMLEAAILCVKALATHVEETDVKHQPEKPKGSPLDGIAAVFESPYLLGICAYMFLYTFTSSFLYFGRSAAVKAAVAGDGGAAHFFAASNLAVSAITLVLQVTLTGRIIAGLGVSVALALVPVWTAAGFTALAIVPSLAIYALFDVSRKIINYAVARPARELLYTVVSREEKYAAKNFIDTFIYRAGDAMASLAAGVIGAWIATTDALQKSKTTAAVAVPFAVVFVICGVLLGRAQQRKAAARSLSG